MFTITIVNLDGTVEYENVHVNSHDASADLNAFAFGTMWIEADKLNTREFRAYDIYSNSFDRKVFTAFIERVKE